MWHGQVRGNAACVKWRGVRRNAWANYYQYMGQSIFLQHLQKVGSSAHVIFMDMDVLILDDIMEVGAFPKRGPQVRDETDAWNGPHGKLYGHEAPSQKSC